MEQYFPMEYMPIHPLCISSVGKYSISKPGLSRKIIQEMTLHVGSLETKTITDATANNGGDTIRFSRHFRQVNSIELKLDEYDILCKNVEAFQCKNVILYHGDCKDILPTIEQDIVYFDPPWGGHGYHVHKKLDLYIGIHLIDYILTLKHKCKYCFIKIPSNFNMSYLKDIPCHCTELTRHVHLLFLNMDSIP